MTQSEAPAASRWARLSFALGVVVACAQVAFGWGFAEDDFTVTAAVAWIAALAIAAQGRSRGDPPSRLLWRALGLLVTAAGLAAVALPPQYHPVHRLLPLVAGAALVLAAAGPRGWAAHRKELLLLALPILNPFPIPLRRLVEPAMTAATAWAALAVDRAAGIAATLDGDVLHMPNGTTLDVLPACSGLLGISRLFVLAALVIALFPTTVRQRLALFATAAAIGFVGNAARIGGLAVTVMHEDDGAFDYWHYGTGATLYTVASSAVAGLAWWLLLRKRTGAPEASPGRADPSDTRGAGPSASSASLR
jgi:cyanoexosortase A